MPSVNEVQPVANHVENPLFRHPKHHRNRKPPTRAKRLEEKGDTREATTETNETR